MRQTSEGGGIRGGGKKEECVKSDRTSHYSDETGKLTPSMSVPSKSTHSGSNRSCGDGGSCASQENWSGLATEALERLGIPMAKNGAESTATADSDPQYLWAILFPPFGQSLLLDRK